MRSLAGIPMPKVTASGQLALDRPRLAGDAQLDRVAARWRTIAAGHSSFVLAVEEDDGVLTRLQAQHLDVARLQPAGRPPPRRRPSGP